MANEEREVRTQEVQQGDTHVQKQTVTHRSTDASVTMGEKVVYLIYSVIAGLLAIRFVLSLLGANRSNPFADFIYSITAPLVAPFAGLFNIDTTYGVSRVDIESLIAILVYGLIALVIVKIFDLGKNDTEI